MRFLARPELIVLLACSTAVFVYAQRPQPGALGQGLRPRPAAPSPGVEAQSAAQIALQRADAIADRQARQADIADEEGAESGAMIPEAAGQPQPAPLAMQRLAPGTRLIRTLVVDGVIVAEDRGEAVPDDTPGGPIVLPIAGGSIGGQERLIYSNTLGRNATSFIANVLISDDMTTTAAPGCTLSRFSFDVTGRVYSSDPTGGPYTINWALYDTCPYAVTAGPPRDARRVVFGSVQVPDDAPRSIEIVLQDVVAIPNHLWLGLRFSRTNAGVIAGAPAQVGFTKDVIDHPSFACMSTFGGFPYHPHASFNVQMWGIDCPAANPKYDNRHDSGASARAEQWIADEITLLSPGCLIRSYAVGVRGPGTYNFELRESCGGPAIPGTERTQIVGLSSASQPRIFEYTFDPPIAVPRTFIYAVRSNNSGAGPLLVEYPYYSQPSGIGTAVGCAETNPSPLHFSVLCDGPAPVGACCDMYRMECVGGPFPGELCDIYPYTDCSPGTCEPVCSEVPQVNCPFPPNGLHALPAWDEGKTCASDPQPDGAFPKHLCGQAACCTSDDTCVNLTRDECADYHAGVAPTTWQRGSFCGEDGQYCPFAACVWSGGGDCTRAADTAGCWGDVCCQTVCSADPWCCRVEWDRGCVEIVDRICHDRPLNDNCFYGDFPSAAPVGANSSVTFTNRRATEGGPGDPTTCVMRSEYRCNYAYGLPCETDDDCGGDGHCTLVDLPAYNTVWFKFTAEYPSAQISTCNSPTSSDASIHVFASAFPGANPCGAPALIGCAAADGCGTAGQACLCVEGLTPGQEYAIMIGSGSPETAGVYQLDITSPCDGARCCPREDCNNNCVNDYAEITTGDSPDCNLNSVPDACDLAPLTDCDSDGELDLCELAQCPPGGSCYDDMDAYFDCLFNLQDFALFQNCFSQELVRELGCCYVMDSCEVPDGFVDLRDYNMLWWLLRD